MVFNCFWLFVLVNHWPILYIVLHCCFGRSFLFFFCFLRLCSFIFSLVGVSFHNQTIMRTWLSTSTYSYAQTIHVSRLLYSLPADRIGRETTLFLYGPMPKIQRRVATHPLIAAVDESVAGGTELYTLIRQASAYYYGLLRPLRVVRRSMECRFVPKKQYTALL